MADPDHIIKYEQRHDLGDFKSPMNFEEPPPYRHHGENRGELHNPKMRGNMPHFVTETIPAPAESPVLTDIGGIPFMMDIKMEVRDVDQYLSEGPSLPEVSSKPPARQISPPVFSPLPSSARQDPHDPTRVVGERSTTNHVANLYEYIQRHAPRNSVISFDFKEPHQQQFSVVLRLNGMAPIEPPHDLKGDDREESPRLFPSKKAAKEEVARLALERLKSTPAEPEHIVLGAGKSKSESFLGELNKYCSQNGLPRPHIIDTSNSKPPFLYGCQITLDIDGERVFGDGTPNAPNKKSAQNAAAKLALEWIEKENPKIIKAKGKSGKSTRILAPGSLVEIDATGKKIGEVATEACVLLGFKAPQRKLEPVEGMIGMYNVFVTLEHADHISRVGPIKNIYGKKNASEEAMKVTLSTVQALARVRFGVTLEITGERTFSLFK